VVDREETVRIDSNAKETRVCVDNIRVIANFEIVQYRRRAKISKLSTILDTIEFWWVDSMGVILVENAFHSSVTDTANDYSIITIINDFGENIGLVALFLFFTLRNPKVFLVSSDSELKIVWTTPN
jgi:hypothetical protein